MTKPATIPERFVRISGRPDPKRRTKARKPPLAELVRKSAQKNKSNVDWNKFLEMRKTSRIVAALAYAPDYED